MGKLMSLVGLLVLIGVAFALSNNKKKIQWRTVAVGVGLQLLFAAVILNTEVGVLIFQKARDFFVAILDFSIDGSRFIFGDLTKPAKFGFIFAFMVLPTIIFMSSLMSILYHLGVMQILIKFVAKIMMKTMGTSGGESLAAAANIFAGQTEAPLVVKPYIEKMTNSEIMALMTGGMATVAGGVLAAYVGMGIDAGHLLAASVISAPAALVCAKLMIPESQESQTAGDATLEIPNQYVNLIDAASTGASEGLKLALNVGAMLLAFIALVALFNGILSTVGGWFNFPELTLDLLLGYLFAPIAFIIGVPWDECMKVGLLIGKKTAINEFVAYVDLIEMKSQLSERSIVIATYALCGFANFSSIAIQVGGIGTIAPSRRKDLARLGVKSLIAGTIACLMTACIAGLFV